MNHSRAWKSEKSMQKEQHRQRKKQKTILVCSTDDHLFHRAGEATLLSFLHFQSTLQLLLISAFGLYHLKDMAFPAVQSRILFNLILMCQQHETLLSSLFSQDVTLSNFPPNSLTAENLPYLLLIHLLLYFKMI